MATVALAVTSGGVATRATVTLTDFMTRASLVNHRSGRFLRNAVISVIGQLPPARRQMALHYAQSGTSQPAKSQT